MPKSTPAKTAKPSAKTPYNRVLIKLSGERFGAPKLGKVLDVAAIAHLAREIASLQQAGLQVGVVIGAGNIVRGHEIAEAGLDEVQGHQMGMLAIVINALALQSVLEQQGQQTRVMSAFEVNSFCEPYIRRRALKHLEKGRVVIFAGGTGNPFFSSDTAGALRAIEIGADILVKATKVDGIYTADPTKDKNAKHIAKITYQNVLVENLQVMDAAAIALCKENGMPLLVCSIDTPGNLLAALRGEAKCTTVTA